MKLGHFDFETYSEGGYLWDGVKNKWVPIPEITTKKGLKGIGATAYAEHHSTEVLSLAYDIDRPRLWTPSCSPPVDLFRFIEAGGLLEAVNSYFEFIIWLEQCHKKMGWPYLPIEQTRDTSAKARAHGLPGGLDKMGKALGASIQKDADGKRLIDKFSIPHKPSKKDPRRRIHPDEEPEDRDRLYRYNLTDVAAEKAASGLIPELTPGEMEAWLLDQRINARGVHIDQKAMGDCFEIVRQATEKYTAELRDLTRGKVSTHGELEKLKKWLSVNGLTLPNMQKKTLEAAYELKGIPGECKRALEIRLALNSAAVLKLKAIKRQLSGDGRLKNMYSYCGAQKTGRWSAGGPQPQNLKKDGSSSVDEWDIEAVETALVAISHRSLEYLEVVYGDPLNTVGGCIRGLFTSAPGHDLIASDYSAIEAVALAVLSGEEWRLEVFRTHGKIYEMSASRISGIPFEEFIDHKERTGKNHPLRASLGKIAELASGYQGYIGAWKAFGAEKHFSSDEEIKQAVLKWRDQNKNIVEFWGGQYRQVGKTWTFVKELYGVEGAAIKAIMDPGKWYPCRLLAFMSFKDVLYMRLPSGRLLSYHKPRLFPAIHRLSKMPSVSITHMGWNSDRDRGPVGWTRLEIWGGKFVENATQAATRDYFAAGMVRLEKRGYPIVLHSHDEPAAEVKKGRGSVSEFEAVMVDSPKWCRGWPIRAGGGWRGKRYRKA